MQSKKNRSRLWIDPAFQGRLLLRMAAYLLIYSLAIFHFGFAFYLMADIATHGIHAGAGDLYLEYLAQQKSLLISLILFMPVLLYNLLGFSNRIAGPLFRCRKVMEEMAEGKQVPEFHPRKRDLMGPLFQAFNRLILAWNAQKSETRNGSVDHAFSEQLPGGQGPGREKLSENMAVAIMTADRDPFEDA